ncbi:uncharacterized protein KY384_006535 [Bacidia gigantensis]|uniref:uncharacterized protein n=1 Tax=Bacidia gigantensis TaxID=2732470 RepID=UPI001D04C0A0|nr:uncharacterized protein KY384_006535 [Bacidia gigantensis]KAG8528846.1 hypothetical protein KY384_006535 [Bacidia gigantensis]
MFAKFRPPLLKNINGHLPEEEPCDKPTGPTPKRRKINNDHEPQSVSLKNPRQDFKTLPTTALPREPLVEDQNRSNTIKVAGHPNSESESYYNVLWRKPTAKKHRTWNGDGILQVKDGWAYFTDDTGREMGKTVCDRPLLPGSSLSIAGKDVEIDSILPKKEYLAGRSCRSKVNAVPPPKKTGPPKQKSLLENRKGQSSHEETATSSSKEASHVSIRVQDSFRAPLLKNTVLPKQKSQKPTPRHDITAEGALVMKAAEAALIGRELVDVVVDPLLSQKLREHQREGVKFLYECVMGLRDPSFHGAILGDEMGLGKTLQTITLLWTLMKQNPVNSASPVIKKALIVCPVTLVNNWRKEFRKWLGLDRIGVYFFDDSKKRITDFTRGRAYQIMIVGYEKLRAVIDDLKNGCEIDIVIADEGHRLKTAKNKSAQAIKSLETPRKIILSGTPIQNDLSEFFMMFDLINPGLLGTFKNFTRQYEVPIVKSRQPGASSEDIEKGEARSEALVNETSPFILRRTADILSKYLPVKTEYVLMCRPTAAQASVYQHVLACPAFQSALGSSEAALQLITILKKVCNSPWLLNGQRSEDTTSRKSTTTSALLDSVPSRLIQTNQGSTKLRALDRLLFTLKTNTNEKVVLVSNYTATLQILESLLTTLGYPYSRLDGSTPSNKRQGLVDDFNRSDPSLCFAFLLSAKAGGLGLNLIEAILRHLSLFNGGGIDEKIWQRQVTKLGLASNIMDQKNESASFSKEELKDLFRLDTGLSCQTHDLLCCKCDGRGVPELPTAEETDLMDDNRGTDNIEEDDVDEDLPDWHNLPTLVPANKLNIEEQEREIDERRKATKKFGRAGAMVDSLMSYSHIDTSRFSSEDNQDMEALISDEVLLRVLKDEDNTIPFVFAKTSSTKKDA